MASAAVRSKRMVLRLFVYSLLLLPLFVGGLSFGLCFQNFVSLLILQSSRWEREPVALLLCYECLVAIIVLLTPSYGAICWFTSWLKL